MEAVKDTPSKEEAKGPLPTLTEPSDHVLLSAQLS